MVPRVDAAVRKREVREFGAARAALLQHPALHGAPDVRRAAGAAPLGVSGAELCGGAPLAGSHAVRALLRAHFDGLVRRQLGNRWNDPGVVRAATERTVPDKLPSGALRRWAMERDGVPPGLAESREDRFVRREKSRQEFLKLLEAYPVRGMPLANGAVEVEKELAGAKEALRREKDAKDALIHPRAGDNALSALPNGDLNLEPRQLRSGKIASGAGAGAGGNASARTDGASVLNGEEAEAAGVGNASVDGELRRSRRKGRSVSGIENGALAGVRDGRVTKLKGGRGASAGGAVSGRVGGKGSHSACCLCPDPALFGGVELDSELTGPYVNKKGRPCLRVHFECACWAPQIYIDQKTQKFRQVCDEYNRGRHLRCAGCQARGATVGCYVDKCKKVFHFRCLDRAGARRVNRHFVAFCANHKHLADLKSYKLMMEAASIADVASVVSKDSTYGLDTPHARYTMLRRSQTELIFSARAQISSHPAVFESAKVIFATKRRDVVRPHERIVVKDRPRKVRVSALDVANGRLALLAQERYDANLAVTAAEQSSAKSGPDEKKPGMDSKYVPIFLLRNLERAPDYTPEDIKVVKTSTSSRRMPGTPASANKRARSSTPRETPSSKRRQLGSGSFVGVDGGGDSVGGSGEVGGNPLRESVALSSVNPPSQGLSEMALPGTRDGTRKHSVELLEPGRLVLRLALTEAGMDRVGERRKAEEQAKNEMLRLREEQERHRRKREERQERRKHKDKELQRKREAAGALLGVTVSKAGVFSLQNGGVLKAKTAWDIFLDEHLPVEQSKRPDDSVEQAKRNIARLWGLLSRLDRAVYEEKARQSLAGISLPSTCDVPGGDAGVASAVKAAQAAAAATRIVRGAPPPYAARSPRRPLVRKNTRNALALSGERDGGGSEPMNASASVTGPNGPRGFVGTANHQSNKALDTGEDAEEDVDSAFKMGLFCKTSIQPVIRTPTSNDCAAGGTGSNKRTLGIPTSVGLPRRSSGNRSALGRGQGSNEADLQSKLDSLFPTSVEDAGSTDPPPAGPSLT